MVRFIRALPLSVEFAAVILLAFGPAVVNGAIHFAYHRATPPISDAHLLSLLIYEPVLFVLLYTFLRIRGRTLRGFGLWAPEPLQVLAGIGLFALIYLSSATLWLVAWSISPATLLAAVSVPVVAKDGLSLPIIAVAALINPLFEEVFVCGYVVSALKRPDNPWLAINVSTGLRLAYHLYQGTRAVFGVLPTGLIFAMFYAWRGQLWPIVVAHALFDFLGLLPFVARAG